MSYSYELAYNTKPLASGTGITLTLADLQQSALEGIVAWLYLLSHKLVSEVKFSSKGAAVLSLSLIAGKSKGVRACGSFSEKEILLSLSKDEIEFWLDIFSRTLLEGFAPTDHFDVECTSIDKNGDVWDLAIRFPVSKMQQLTPAEALAQIRKG